MGLPAEGYRLTDISPKAYEHPADRAATAALASVPMLDQVVRKLIEFGYERALRQAYLGSSVKLGPDQLPETWRVYEQVLATLDMPDVYDLYVTQFPIVNAMTIGSKKADHRAQLRPLEPARRGGPARGAGPRGRAHPLRPRPLPDGAPDPAEPHRRPAAAARRAAAHGGEDGAARVVARRRALLRPRRGARHARPAGHVPHADERQRGDEARQAEPRRLPRPGLRLPRGEQGRRPPPAPVARLGVTRALPVKRVHEVMDWVRGGDFDRIVGKQYPRRGDPVIVGEEAAEAVTFYRERFATTFRDVATTSPRRATRSPTGCAARAATTRRRPKTRPVPGRAARRRGGRACGRRSSRPAGCASRTARAPAAGTRPSRLGPAAPCARPRSAGRRT